MKHLHAYMVTPINGRYTNNKKIGEKELILNTTIENHKFINRKGIIKETPINNSILKTGDEVIVHHNTFRRFYNVRGQAKDSSNYFDNNNFFVYIDQIFLYKRNNKWLTPPGYCFVKPIKNNDLLSEAKEKPLTGVLKYLGGDLKSFNLNNEDIVGFTPNSEYEFLIDGERLYRIPINSISIKYERAGTEVEYNPSWL
tara:strand:+ start:171 stop:764 length:594 start_codon:yes stop_codon:yes gene_type:complete